MFTISQTPLENIALRENFSNPHAGALAIFEGFVRDHSDGKDVKALEYDVFEGLAQKEGRAILEEAKKKFSVIEAKCFHRAGKLSIGEMAVWVGVIAGHRNDAFAACRYIIDEIKKRLPIWKKEYYKDGDSGWVNCKVSPAESTDSGESEFYARQIVLPQVGTKGQEKLKSAKVLVVGAGGLGCPALLYLASAGIGTIGISEFDNLEAHNLHRQVMYDHADVGKPKAELAAKKIKALNPFIDIKTHAEKLDIQNVAALVQSYGIILDCTDNFETKFLLNDACHFAGKPFICASVYQFEGQVKFYKPREADSSCLRCLWPNIPEPGCIGNCATAGILGVIPGILGTLQAAEAIKHALGLPCLLSDEILIFDLLTYRTKKLKQVRDRACPLCGTHPTIRSLDAKNYGQEAGDTLDISKISLKEFESFEIIDVREPAECRKKPATVKCGFAPSSQFGKTGFPFDRSRKYLLFCEQGMRSQRIAGELKKQGISAFSVSGGVNALNQNIKNTWPQLKV